MSTSHSAFYENILQESLKGNVVLKNSSSVSGGCINNAVKLVTNHGEYFLKWNKDISEDMFEKEAKGLALLHDARELRIPGVVSVGEIDHKKYILQEYIGSAATKNDFWDDFGSCLANLHKNHVAENYGLDHQNYIGSLPQINNFKSSWIDFFIENRLEYQLQLAYKNGLVDKKFTARYRAFYKLLPELLPENPPSLLHGDLWSGNFMTGPDGKVCLIDPAVYYGNREIEIAFTRMFGGFDSLFYEAYHEAYPLDPGFERRIDIYNMYPSMVHVNLFGTSYLSGVESVLRRFL